MLESLFIKAAGLKKSFYGICEIFKNTYFEKHLRKADSADLQIRLVVTNPLFALLNLLRQTLV